MCVCVCVCVCGVYIKTCNATLMSNHMDLWILQRNSRVVDDMSRYYFTAEYIGSITFSKC